MLKFASRLLCLVILAVLLFVGLSVWKGGERFRWFGKTVKEESEKVGKQADRIKETTQRVTNTLESTKEKVEQMVGKDGRDTDKDK